MFPQPPTKGNRRIAVGKYQVLEHIATGGMGAVYKARDTETERIVALKVLPPHLADHPAVPERFRREAQHYKKLNHPHLVHLYEVGESDGIHYLALEFVEGIDL